jgi:hypothetical protein
MSFTYSGLPKRAIEIAEVCSLCFVAGFGLDKQTASIYIYRLLLRVVKKTESGKSFARFFVETNSSRETALLYISI